MKLFEHEAKTILMRYAIPVPNGALATSATRAREEASQLRAPYVVKAQVLVAGRGKAGGIQFAETLEEVESVAAKLLEMKIKGLKVRSVWIEEKVEVKRELYFGVTIDRSSSCYVTIASTAGGMNIEEVAERTPGRVIKTPIDPLVGFRGYHARRIACEMGYSGRAMLALAAIFEKLYKVAMDFDAELVEMNPIVEASDQSFAAVDARMIVDDSALFRHREYKARLLSGDAAELTSREVKARKKGLAYVQLDGDVGIMGNGAGLVMATLDAVKLHGGSPANFLDVGGGASEEQITTALEILLTDTNASVVFINILGGITRCDEVARGILEAKEKIGFSKPMVIRMVGTNEKEGRRILTEAGVHVLDSMEEAAKTAVELSRGA